MSLQFGHISFSLALIDIDMVGNKITVLESSDVANDEDTCLIGGCGTVLMRSSSMMSHVVGTLLGQRFIFVDGIAKTWRLNLR